MKSAIITLLLVLPISIFSQKEGSIIYVETTKLEIELPDEVKEMMADFPTERTSEKVLYFKGKTSLYKNSDRKGANEDTEMEHAGGGMHFKFKMSEPDNRTFNDFATKTYTKKQDLLGKTFLIEDEMSKYNWKLGTDKRKILDHVCMNATTKLDDESDVVAWFTTEIPASIGPGSYHGLPGMILAIEVNENEQIIVAKEVNLGEIDSKMMEIPNKGKRVSQEEFDQIKKEKMEEMGAKSGGRGVKVITHTRRTNG